MRGLVEMGFKWNTWNDGWIHRVWGSFSRTPEGLMTLSTTEGPMNLGEGFLAFF